MIKTSCLSLSIGIVVLISSCSKQDATNFQSSTTESRNGKTIRTFYGPSVAIGDGIGRAWVSEDLSGNPTAVGVNLSEGALDSLPEMNDEYILYFNSHSATHFYKHIYLTWSAHGHGVSNLYDMPHFDVHFYSINNSDRLLIGQYDSTQFANLPAAQYRPPSYVKTAGGVRATGAHWIDQLAPEFNGSIFTKTFLWGSYDGKFNFLEPMVTRDYLLTHPDSETSLRQPTAFQQDGWYPQSYTVKYSTTPNQYTIALTNLAFRQGQ